MLFTTPYDPSEDISGLHDKVIIITGANTGIGKEALRFFATYSGPNVKIYLAARTASKAEATLKELKASLPNADIHYLKLDLASLASVKAAADTIKSENQRLDILMNNAGVMALPPSLTTDGYEIQFGTNFMGHYLLTRELLPLLRSTALSSHDVRIVNLSSVGYRYAPTGGFRPEQVVTDMASTSTWARYGQSKLANILHTKELARRYPEITSVSVHPGFVNSDLSRTYGKSHPYLEAAFRWTIPLMAATPAQGALGQVWAAVAPIQGADQGKVENKSRRVVSGTYYVPVAKVGSESAYARDASLAKQLWEWAEKEVSNKGY